MRSRQLPCPQIGIIFVIAILQHVSLPQPSDNELVDGLPLVRLSEDAEVLNSILTMLYPIPSVMPNSYDECLMLLAASQKYDMVGVQSRIRAKIRAKHGCQTGTNEPKSNDIAPQTRDYRAHWPRSRA